MFRLFKKAKQKTSVAHEGWIKLGRYISRKERRLGAWLNDQAAKASPIVLTTIIMSVCIGFATASTYFIGQSIKDGHPMQNYPIIKQHK